MSALLEVRDLEKHFRLPGRRVLQAVSGVSFSIARGETLALVGESGCGKSTIGRCLLRLDDPDGGEIRFDGRRIDNLPARAFRPLRRRIQIVFQDPYGSLDPRMNVAESIAEPLVALGMARNVREAMPRIAELLDMVSLPRASAERRPHEFSGGQRQRIGIARALAVKPDLIVCDEAVSALDVSVKAQIINLLAELRDQLDLAMLFISHDLAIVERIADRVAVMYLGRMVEEGAADMLLGAPAHPYTQGLIAAAPRMDGTSLRDDLLRGELPDPTDPPGGCRFRTRCPHARPSCAAKAPAMRSAGDGRTLACDIDLATGETFPATISGELC